MLNDAPPLKLAPHQIISLGGSSEKCSTGIARDAAIMHPCFGHFYMAHQTLTGTVLLRHVSVLLCYDDAIHFTIIVSAEGSLFSIQSEIKQM